MFRSAHAGNDNLMAGRPAVMIVEQVRFALLGAVGVILGVLLAMHGQFRQGLPVGLLGATLVLAARVTLRPRVDTATVVRPRHLAQVPALPSGLVAAPVASRDRAA